MPEYNLMRGERLDELEISFPDKTFETMTLSISDSGIRLYKILVHTEHFQACFDLDCVDGENKWNQWNAWHPLKFFPTTPVEVTMYPAFDNIIISYTFDDGYSGCAKFGKKEFFDNVECLKKAFFERKAARNEASKRKREKECAVRVTPSLDKAGGKITFTPKVGTYLEKTDNAWLVYTVGENFPFREGFFDVEIDYLEDAYCKIYVDEDDTVICSWTDYGKDHPINIRVDTKELERLF